MEWWKRGLKGSGYLLLFLFIVTVVGFWYIPHSQNPTMTLSESERFGKFGVVIGAIFGVGIVLIWARAYKMRIK
jgi:hypothetical protein